MQLQYKCFKNAERRGITSQMSSFIQFSEVLKI
jgi:hypothetical protein